MHRGAAEFFRTDILMDDGLDHIGAGDEHMRGLIHHEDEIGDRWTVDRTAGTGTHDAGDLRDDAAGVDIAVEDLAVGGERVNPLLDAGPARVVETDDR